MGDETKLLEQKSPSALVYMGLVGLSFLVSGLTSPVKTIEITGVSAETLLQKLNL